MIGSKASRDVLAGLSGWTSCDVKVEDTHTHTFLFLSLLGTIYQPVTSGDLRNHQQFFPDPGPVCMGEVRKMIHMSTRLCR